MKQPAVFLALSVSVCAAPAAVAATSEAELARQHAELGDAFFKASRFKEASAEFDAAFGLLRWPTIGLDAARAHEKNGRLVEAASLYRETVALQADESWPKKPENRELLLNAQGVAQSELAALSHRIPTLRIEITGAPALALEISIDDTRIPSEDLSTPQEVNPGNHTVTATTKDGRRLIREVALAERESRTVSFDRAWLQASAGDTNSMRVVPAKTVSQKPAGVTAQHSRQGSEPRSNLSKLGWIGVAMGGTGLAVGVIAGTVSLVKKSDLEQNGCNRDYQCTDEALHSRDMKSYDTARTVSTVGTIVGGAFAAAGVTLLLVGHNQQTVPQIDVAFSAGYAGVRGRF